MSDDFNKDELPSWLWDDEPEDDSKADRDTPQAESSHTPDPLSDFPWLDDPDEAAEAAEATPSTGDLPDWLASASGELKETPEAEDDLPPWLSSAQNGRQPGQDAGSEPELGDAPPDEFLALGDSLPATSDLEMTYDEWAATQERLRSGPNLEDETPDLLSDIDQPLGSVRPTGELPDWYLGLEELDESDAPEWLTSDEQAGAPAEAEQALDVPSWLDGLEETTPAPSAESGEFDDDFFAALGLAPAEAEAEANDEPDLPSLVPTDEEALDLSWLNDPAVEETSERLRDDAREDDFFSAIASQPQEPLPPPFDPQAEAGDSAEISSTEDIDERTAATLMADQSGDFDVSWLRDAVDSTNAEETGELAERGAVAAEAPEQALEEFFASLDNTEAEEPAPRLPTTEEFSIDWGEDHAAEPQAAGAQEAELPSETAGEAESLEDIEFPWDARPPSEPAEPAASADPFADFDFDVAAPAKDDSEPDWLEALGAVSTSQAADEPSSQAVEEPPLPFAAPSVPGTDELDDFLAGLDDDVAGKLPETGQLDDQTDFNFDFLLEEPAPAAPQGATPFDALEASDLAHETPDFLRDLNVSVGQVSAAAIVRQREDKPLEELPERLRRLHERGESLGAPRQTAPMDQDVLARVLPGVPETLAPASIAAGMPALQEALTLSEDEREKVGILRRLIAKEDGALAAAATADEAIKAAVQGRKARVAKRNRRRYPVDRLLVALALVAATSAPFFVDDLRLGNPPPDEFTAGSAAAVAFDQIDSVSRGDVALVAVEYGPSAAAELDPMLSAIVRHLLLQGARPVLVGGNAVGLLHAANVVEALNGDGAFLSQLGRNRLASNRDYYVVRYLTGGVVGVRALGEAAGNLLLTDIRGQATNLRIDSIEDIDLIVVVAERGDNARSYVEQIAPLSGAPVVLATGYGAGPVVEPYSATGAASGLFVGYQDAMTYLSMLEAPDARETAPEGEDAAASSAPNLPNLEQLAGQFAQLRQALEARSAATEEPATLQPETEAPAADTSVPAAVSSGTPTNTATPTATATVTPSRTPTPTVTPSATPTATATNTSTPTPTLTRTPRPGQPDDIIGTVRSSERSVNVRSGPGTGFRVVGGVLSGNDVIVLGRNEARTWYFVELENGTQGWVASYLVFFEGEFSADDVPVVEDDASAAKLQPFLKPLAQEATAEPDETDEPQDRESPVRRQSAATEEAAATAVATEAPGSGLAYGEERWYAMTLGIIGSATIIGVGAAVNIARALTRRRNR